MRPKVSISIVTWNSLVFIPHLLETIRAQKYVKLEVIVVDNGSNDGSLEYLQQQNDIVLIPLNFNSGFSAAHNKCISKSSGDYILVLNPDVLLTPTYISEMVKAIELGPEIGQVSGKLYQISSFDEIGQSTILDLTGLYF